MAWEAGGRTDAASFEDTKMYDLQQSVVTFANTFLDGEQNTISLVTFGGYDADYTTTVMDGYADTCQTLVTGSSNPSDIINSISNIILIADDASEWGTAANGYWLSFDGGVTHGENYGNTNYDHAFMETYSAVNALKALYESENGISYDESGREI